MRGRPCPRRKSTQRSACGAAVASTRGGGRPEPLPARGKDPLEQVGIASLGEQFVDDPDVLEHECCTPPSTSLSSSVASR